MLSVGMPGLSRMFFLKNRRYEKGLLCQNKDYSKGRSDDVFRDFKLNYIAFMKQISLRYYYNSVLDILKSDF